MSQGLQTYHAAVVGVEEAGERAWFSGGGVQSEGSSVSTEELKVFATTLKTQIIELKTSHS